MSPIRFDKRSGFVVFGLGRLQTLSLFGERAILGGEICDFLFEFGFVFGGDECGERKHDRCDDAEDFGHDLKGLRYGLRESLWRKI